MVNNNKILTVSYGTFSCTLEGFDDSFDTMKAIAEYFRDLASDDRYFGAEPPQLDAEMMARIAQRQISGRVEAIKGEAGIVLRAAEPDVVETVEAVVVEAEAPKEPVARVQTVRTQKVEAKVAKAPRAPDTIAPDTISKVVAKRPLAPVETAATVEILGPVETPAKVKVLAKVAIEPEAPEPKPALKEDSIAAKLRRIRAVVSRNEAAAQSPDQSNDFSEDEHAEPFLTSPTIPVEQDSTEELINLVRKKVAATAVTPAQVVEPTIEPTPAVSVDEDDQYDDAESEIAEVTATIDLGNAEDETPGEEDEISKALARIDAIVSPDVSESEGLFEEDEQTANAADTTDNDDDLSNLLNDVRESKPAVRMPIKARIVKIKRKDFEAAVASGKLETITEDAPESDSSLSDAEEAELQRDLASVEADIEQQNAEFTGDSSDDPLDADFAYDDEDDDEEDDDFQPAGHSAAVEGEVDMSRLMATADDKMEEPETSSRREAYSHLRGAVAVANAEHAAGGSVNEDTDDGVYRDDLASVVRPRRAEVKPAETHTARPRRPTIRKPAPLKLVAEQRVDDRVEPAPRGPVRPRRVSAVQVDETVAASPESEGGFAQFIVDMEVTNLPDMLEAAASYMSFVEGREQFSRPQLMTKVRQIDASDFNREDGLRSFGKLLRDGKIQKTGGGRFTASEDIGFRPDERAAG